MSPNASYRTTATCRRASAPSARSAATSWRRPCTSSGSASTPSPWWGAARPAGQPPPPPPGGGGGGAPPPPRQQQGEDGDDEACDPHGSRLGADPADLGQRRDVTTAAVPVDPERGHAELHRARAV